MKTASCMELFDLLQILSFDGIVPLLDMKVSYEHGIALLGIMIEWKMRG